MEFKGTKGDWYVDSENPFIIWHPTIIGEVLIECTSKVQIEGTKGFFARYSEEEAKANAQLISCAPEMLEMLQYFVDENMLSITGEEMAKELIKKATEI